MKIGYMCPYEKLGCGEKEARIRWTYLLEKKGCTVIPLNKKCRTFDTNEHADNLNLDLIITAQVIEMTETVYPDVPTCFFWWCPSSFFPNQLREDYLRYMGKYDFMVGGYESKNPVAALVASPYFTPFPLLPLMASVPTDFAIGCEEKENLKFFYVGMGRRYEKLLKNLEEKNLVDIYGPKKVFGQEPWAGFKSYRGTIPYDGKIIIRKMHEAGIVLALHSKSHNREDFVSNRIFEAAAAGAIIIADDNKFIRRYFGDSVYYLDIFKGPEEQERELAKILDTIFSNKKVAFEKAKRAQKIFLEKLSLDRQVDAFLEFIEKENLKRKQFCNKWVDCIVCVENENEFYHVQEELKKQCYTKLHLIIVAEENVFSKIRNHIAFEYSYCVKTDDNFSSDIIAALKGEFFILLNKNSVLHCNHIFKAVQVLSRSTDDFTYSGSYEKIMKNNVVQDYRTLSCRPYNFLNILADLQMSDDSVRISYFLKNFPGCCFMFRRGLIISAYEMVNMPLFAAHLYLCIKSVLLDSKKHSFMYTISAGKTGTGFLEKRLFFDHLARPKEEILEKLRTNLWPYFDKYNENSIQHVEEFLPLHIKIVILKTLVRWIKFKRKFVINKALRKKYENQICEIEKLLQGEKNV